MCVINTDSQVHRDLAGGRHSPQRCGSVPPGDSDAKLGTKSTEPATLAHVTDEQAAACGRHEARPVTPLEPEPGVADFQPITLSAIPNHLLSCILQTQPFGNRPVTTGTGARAGRGSGGRKGGEDGRWLVLRWERGTYKR